MADHRPKRKFAVLDVMVRNAQVTGHRSENCLNDCFLKTSTHTIDRKVTYDLSNTLPESRLS